MERYADIDNDSGVVAYEVGATFIRVQFSDGAIYLYTASSTGLSDIERMKQLARAGEGLNSFIMRNVGRKYAIKES